MAVRLFEVFYLLTQGFGLKNKKEEGMKRLILIALLALGLGFGLTLMASTPSMAVHKGSGDLTCGSCHTMHSSQGGTSSPSMGGATGALILLRNSLVTGRETIHQLCLQCHAAAGTQGGVQFNACPGTACTTPPKVLLTSTDAWNTTKDFSTIGAGGDFQFVGSYVSGSYNSTQDGGTALGRGHSIGGTVIAPPGNGSTVGTIATFSCTTCHDPHGTSATTSTINIYRNLKGGIVAGATDKNWSNMLTNGNIGTSYVGGPTGASDDNSLGTTPTGGSGIAASNNIWPTYRSSGTQNSYSTSTTPPTLGGTALTGLDGTGYTLMSAFCAQCHSLWHENVTTGNKTGSDWNRHPVDNRISDTSSASGAGVTITDFTHYNTNIAAGFKLPAANDAGSAFYYADNSGDKVFCLSCHFAHGSPYYDILRWDYIAQIDAAGGSQTGNGVASVKGCQQCHNR
ncbi:MAG: hypothetical protein A3G39_09765 [Deltaproteobacteria bacterium RIFCSPLOWO2_12_FULL_43_16]|nr:MAG: hypothetical protein A2Z89_06145 [Deltaproteobacteria bacterium GWA2_43_19]OGQ10991.1 MAG: hypothetical protein A3D30_01875 [Deltaproteobacteria bacterium RIFCSPHIGHO2_02_FULL_43_33]OGQ60132.1 MAG: hypothetical protein A3G39_09765 [Deltaproteobacteria bacterium RIFCSPLOWO2_12_FULL_43_16]HBR16190.1 hypothetical protein [Deltaproteobacteria bacterium]